MREAGFLHPGDPQFRGRKQTWFTALMEGECYARSRLGRKGCGGGLTLTERTGEGTSEEPVEFAPPQRMSKSAKQKRWARG